MTAAVVKVVVVVVVVVVAVVVAVAVMTPIVPVRVDPVISIGFHHLKGYLHQ